MVIAIDKKWIWDSWYAKDGDTYHGFFLQADTSLGDPDLRHLNVTQGHATSKDLVNWTHLGTMFGPSKTAAWDDSTTWTGSVVQDGAGLWHLFYTGTTLAENSLYQRIGHATSTDLHSWERVGDGLCLDLTGPNADTYEKDHMVGHWLGAVVGRADHALASVGRGHVAVRGRACGGARRMDPFG